MELSPSEENDLYASEDAESVECLGSGQGVKKEPAKGSYTVVEGVVQHWCPNAGCLKGPDWLCSRENTLSIHLNTCGQIIAEALVSSLFSTCSQHAGRLRQAIRVEGY